MQLVVGFKIAMPVASQLDFIFTQKFSNQFNQSSFLQSNQFSFFSVKALRILLYC